MKSESPFSFTKDVNDSNFFDKYGNPHEELVVPTPPVVTIWHDTVQNKPYESPIEVVYRRTVTEEDRAEIDRLTTLADAAKNGTSSGEWKIAQGQVDQFVASLTEVFFVDVLQRKAQTDQYAYQQCKELGIETY